jgi:cytoskeletal protein CcmA (bactofilin family)
MSGLHRRFNTVRCNGLTVYDNIDVDGDFELDGIATVGDDLLVGGTITVDESVDVTLDVDVGGDVNVSGNLSVDGTADVGVDLLVDGEIVVIGDVTTSGTFIGEARVTLDNGSDVNGIYTYDTMEDEVTLLGGLSTTTAEVPAGATILAVQMIVKKAVADDDGDDTWTAAFAGGSIEDLNGGAPLAKDMNTKASEVFENIVASAATTIAFSPNGTNFTAGVIVVRVLYAMPEVLPNYVDTSEAVVTFPDIEATVAFDAEVTGALDFWGEALGGANTVTVTSDVDGIVFNAAPVFTVGAATLPAITLTTAGAHELTTVVTGVTAPDVQNVTAEV